MSKSKARSRIVSGTIKPIKASDLRLGRLSVLVPLSIPGIHVPKLLSHEPLVVAPETLEHARQCAARLIANMANLPHTEQAGDLLAM